MDVAGSPLVERSSDLQQLDAAIARAVRGEGALVWIEGPPGIGKSSVLREARERAADDGMRVLAARAGELERPFEHGVVRQLFERAVLSAAPAEREPGPRRGGPRRLRGVPPAPRGALRRGQRRRGLARIAEQEQRARHWGTPSAAGIALHGRALISPRDEAAGLLERAVASLRDSPARLDLARALSDHGAALRRAGKRTEAQERLEQAVLLAQELGATVLAQRANEELATAGARPRRLQFSGAESLTASGRRVSAMAAEGLSNSEIAQVLYVTAKTVENHLGRVYIKRGIRSRGELSDALAA